MARFSFAVTHISVTLSHVFQPFLTHEYVTFFLSQSRAFASFLFTSTTSFAYVTDNIVRLLHFCVKYFYRDQSEGRKENRKEGRTEERKDSSDPVYDITLFSVTLKCKH